MNVCLSACLFTYMCTYVHVHISPRLTCALACNTFSSEGRRVNFCMDKDSTVLRQHKQAVNPHFP